MKPEDIKTLRRIRLERDWSYLQLALAMKAHPATIYRILTKPDHPINERTAYKIQRFLNAEKAKARKQGAAA